MVSFQKSDDPALKTIKVQKVKRLSLEDQLKNLTEMIDRFPLDQYAPNSFEFQLPNNIVDLTDSFASKTLDAKYWKAIFVIHLRAWGFNTASALKLFSWGAEGHNWKNLHPSIEESNRTFDEAREEFYGEVSYCSDRMGFDRLFRCHWLYNQMMMKKER